MKAVAFMYHDVTPAGREDASGLPGGDAARYKLEPEQFNGHLRAIAAAAAGPAITVDTADLQSARLPLLLTFDDGGSSAVRIADLLERLGWRGHFFVTGAYIDRPGFLGRRDIRALRSSGHAIGSHSFSHPLRMAHLPAGRLGEEWTQSVALLSDILGERVTIASVPGGDHSRAVTRAAADAGIRFLFTSVPRVHVRRAGAVSVIGRYVVQRSTGPRIVASVAAGSALPRARQLALWESKKVVKAVAGRAYLMIRNRVLGGSRNVRWGDA